MAQRRLSVLDVILTIVSLLTLLLDVGTDILVTVGLYLDGHLVWGSLMVAFIVLPLLVMNVLSLKWHAADQSLTCLTVLPHAFLVSPIQRYIQVVRFGMLSRLTGHPRYTDAALREQNDVCILRLVETFMESAPQLVLQLYIMLQTPAHVNWLHGLSAACSLVSLAWAMTAYSDTLRLAYQTTYQRRLVALVLHCLWQLTMVAARMAALVLFAFVFKAWVCLFAGLHWIAMTTCICITGTDFGSGKVERFLFRVVSGFIYIFVFLNLHDGPSRGRMGAYYCLMLLENAVLYAVWVIYGHNEIQVLNIAAPVIVFGGFLVGAVFLMIYYRWLHPSGPNYLFSLKTAPSLSQQHRRSRQAEHRPIQNTSGQSPSVLELSIESRTSNRELNREGNANLSHLLDSSARNALESAWQSGMHSSDSSSNSSLDEEDCSMEDFNTSAKSALCDTTKKSQKSQSSNNTTLSQTSIITVRSVHPGSSSRLQLAQQEGDRSQSPTSPVNLSATGGSRSLTENLQSSAESGAGLEEVVVLNSSRREAADGGESVPEGPDERRSRRQSLSPIPEMSVAQRRYTSPLAAVGPVVQEHEADAATTSQPESAESDIAEQREERTQLSPLDVGQLWAESRRRAASADTSRSHLGAYNRERSPGVQPFVEERVGMGSALETVMSSPDAQGGESMWVASPDTSTSSSAQHRRLVDSFDSESEPVCANTASLKHLKQAADESHDAESSWTSMNVNADDLSCVENLKCLSPEDSMCSFNSSTDKRDKGNESIHQPVTNQTADSSPCSANESVARSPCLSRSRSMSSMNDDFCLEGFTPSPPLRSVLQRSRHSAGGHSWMDTPESWKEQPLPDTPWRLDYLNLDPAPPVEREAYFHRYDPRDVVIDLLLDQLKRASLRSNRSRPELSPLRLSHMQESPQRLGRNVDLFDRRAWRNLFMDNTGSAGPSHYSREEIHRLKEALDLIEMQQSPRVYRRQTPETASPEMYVSGQYRPPICTGGRREQMASQKHAGAPSASRPGPQQYSQRPVLDMPLNMSDHRSPRADDHHRRVRHRSEDVHTPTEEKHGLYRYFVGSDSPATAAPPCTPHWNTPVNTTTTPTQRHLLRRYLSENQAAGDSQVLRKAQQSVAATKSLRPSSVIQEVEQGARRPLHRPYSASYQDRKSVPQDSSFDRSMSRRQPLQTLDNSPSLSPDSACNQPVADDSEPLKPRTSRSGRRSVDPISDSSDSRYLRPTVQPHRSTSHSSGAAAGVAKKKSSTGHLR